MLAIISPAKNMLKYEVQQNSLTEHKAVPLSKLSFPEKTQVLANLLKTYESWELESLMKINPQLGLEAFAHFQDFSLEKQGTPALLTYDGLVFKQIKAEKMTKKQLEFSQNHLRILSGFYGMVKPLDGILPYRLEMQTKLSIEGQNLYGFWQNQLYEALYKETPVVVNLASEEYAKCIRKFLTPGDVFIDVQFLTMKGGKLKNLATFAKMARGQMVRYMIEQGIKKTEKLKDFQWNGYEFQPQLSHDRKYIFIKS